MSTTKHNRKLSNYLLDKELQLRYVVFVTVMSAIICGVLGYLIWQQADVATGILEKQFAAHPEMAKEYMPGIRANDRNLIFTMVGIGVALVVLLSLLLVIMTHKVAGPLYKVTLYFDKMTKGRLDTVWPLRKYDMLQNFYEKFRAAHTAVRARHVEINENLKNFVELADKHGVTSDGELGHRLEELRKHVKHRDEALS